MKDSVSLRDVYDAVNSLEEKIDKRLERDENRLDKLESFQDRALGIMSILTVVLTAGFNYIWNRVFNR